MAKRSTHRTSPQQPDNVITVAEIEWCLDRLALEMQRVGKRGVTYLPIYERLESELVAAREHEAMLERARDRAARVMRDLDKK